MFDGNVRWTVVRTCKTVSFLKYNSPSAFQVYLVIYNSIFFTRNIVKYYAINKINSRYRVCWTPYMKQIYKSEII